MKQIAWRKGFYCRACQKWDEESLVGASRREEEARQEFETMANTQGPPALTRAKEGDTITVMPGGAVLYILQSVADTLQYEFIGEWWVNSFPARPFKFSDADNSSIHGIMDGEAARDETWKHTVTTREIWGDRGSTVDHVVLNISC